MYESKSICSAFPAAQTAIQSARGMCECLPEAFDALSEIKANSVTADTIQAAVSTHACLIENGFNVQHNRAERLREEQNDQDYIILGPELGVDLYAFYLVSAAGCYVGATCEAMITRIISYFNELVSEIGDGLVDTLRDMIQTRIIDRALSSSDGVVAGVERKLAPVESCVRSGSQAVLVFNNVNVQLEQLCSNLHKSRQVATRFGSNLDALQETFRSLDRSYREHIQALLGGEGLDVADGVKFLISLDGARSLITDVDKFRSLLAISHGNIQGVWHGLQNLRVIAGRYESDCISSFAESFVADNVETILLNAFRNAFSLEYLDIDANTFQAGLLTYNQWFEISMKVPCTRSAKREFRQSVAGVNLFSASLTYPELYLCDYAKRVPTTCVSSTCHRGRCCESNVGSACSSCAADAGKCAACRDGFDLTVGACVVTSPRSGPGALCDASDSCLSDDCRGGRYCKASTANDCASCNAVGDCVPTAVLDPKTRAVYERAKTLAQSANWRSRTGIEEFYGAIGGSRQLVQAEVDRGMFEPDTFSEKESLRYPDPCKAAISEFGRFLNFMNNRFKRFKQRVNAFIQKDCRMMVVPDELEHALLNQTMRVDPTLLGSGDLDALTLAHLANWRSRTAIEDFYVSIGARREIVDVAVTHEMSPQNYVQLEAVLLRSSDEPKDCLAAMETFNRFFNFLNYRFKRFKTTVGLSVQAGNLHC
ncbi:hypothetical protein FVE85_5701 [Porphyridium purpureum]|uniref:Uncharacterized protein n=1 Tax=Porphyridium purpureum TaxID=35688 RepID=A0A5J4Z3C8_PORPP|nr:hypothetical protein FVE85_5701 [Porphyridium purpureum]|eukprot:POR3643..scf295_1